MHTRGLDRSPAQFFFEVGYAACFAEMMIRNDLKPPFELTDKHIEIAWPRSIEAHEDGEEMDRYLALAEAAPDLLDAAKEVDRTRTLPGGSKAHAAALDALRAAIARATDQEGR